MLECEEFFVVVLLVIVCKFKFLFECSICFEGNCFYIVGIGGYCFCNGCFDFVL